MRHKTILCPRAIAQFCALAACKTLAWRLSLVPRQLRRFQVAARSRVARRRGAVGAAAWRRGGGRLPEGGASCLGRLKRLPRRHTDYYALRRTAMRYNFAAHLWFFGEI